jgi:hypothetical protein
MIRDVCTRDVFAGLRCWPEYSYIEIPLDAMDGTAGLVIKQPSSFVNDGVTCLQSRPQLCKRMYAS